MAFTIPGLPPFPQTPAPPLRYAQGACYEPNAFDQMLALNSEYTNFRVATIGAKSQLIVYGSLQDPAVAAKLGITEDPNDGSVPPRWAFAVLFYGDNPTVTWNFAPPGTKLV